MHNNSFHQSPTEKDVGRQDVYYLGTQSMQCRTTQSNYLDNVFFAFGICVIYAFEANSVSPLNWTFLDFSL